MKKKLLKLNIASIVILILVVCLLAVATFSWFIAREESAPVSMEPVRFSIKLSTPKDETSQSLSLKIRNSTKLDFMDFYTNTDLSNENEDVNQNERDECFNEGVWEIPIKIENNTDSGYTGDLLCKVTGISITDADGNVTSGVKYFVSSTQLSQNSAFNYRNYIKQEITKLIDSGSGIDISGKTELEITDEYLFNINKEISLMLATGTSDTLYMYMWADYDALLLTSESPLVSGNYTVTVTAKATNADTPSSEL